MGSYSYCSYCPDGLDKATIDEVLNGKQLCYHCGCYNEPNRSLGDVVQELAEITQDLQHEVRTLRKVAHTHYQGD